MVDDGTPMSINVKNLVKKYNYRDNLRYVVRTRSVNDLHTASNAINFGLEFALNKSLEIFTSKERSNLFYVVYLHSDDILPFDGIKKRTNEIQDSSFVFSKTMVIGKRNKKKIT